MDDAEGAGEAVLVGTEESELPASLEAIEGAGAAETVLTAVGAGLTAGATETGGLLPLPTVVQAPPALAAAEAGVETPLEAPTEEAYAFALAWA